MQPAIHLTTADNLDGRDLFDLLQGFDKGLLLLLLFWVKIEMDLWL
ncbi:MAG: hypothetical protein Q9M13_09325 [Mariprofundales bacterium]|nr:hypothetical protein [Mariprofundales bacterium]